MRVAFVGATAVTVETARALLGKGHEVIIVEPEKPKIDDLSDELDCSFVHGDGTRPDILRELSPKQTDVLFCLGDSDQENVISSLVGRSLGFGRVVTSIVDPQFEGICRELGLEDTIVPSRTISRYLQDLVQGTANPDLSMALKDDARLFVFDAGADDAGPVSQLDLPKQAGVICLYRDGKFLLTGPETELRKGDEVVILTRSDNLPALQKRWQPDRQKDESPGEKETPPG